MAKKRTSGDYYDILRARFAGETAARGQARFRPPADPTDHFFGAAPAADESPAPRLFDPAGVRPLADGVATRIAAQGAAQTRLLGYGVRLLIAALWLAFAGWYVRAAAGGDGAALAKLFLIIAGAGAAAAIFGALITFASRKTGLNRTKEEAIILGQRLALETHSLDCAIDRRVDAVSADVFLKSISFADGGDAGAEKFNAYLKREPGRSAAKNGARLFLIALAATAALAAALGLGVDASALPLSEYPFALGAVLIGAAVYGGAGFLAQLFGKSARAGRERKAEAAAFAAAQSAFSTAGGVAPANLTARLHRSAAAGNMAKPSMDERGEYESPRAPDSPKFSRDSAPAFVETGFQASPKPFRTDAFEKKFRP